MTALEIAERAYALIEDPARWTQGTFARDKDGGGVNEMSEAAVCWCSLGATYKTAGAEPYGAVEEELREAFGDCWIGVYNDTHTHAEVLAGWRRAIESLRTKETPCT